MAKLAATAVVLCLALLGCERRKDSWEEALDRPLVDSSEARRQTLACSVLLHFRSETTPAIRRRCHDKALEAIDIFLAAYDKDPTTLADVCYKGLEALNNMNPADPRVTGQRARAEALCCVTEPFPDCPSKGRKQHFLGGWDSAQHR